MGMNTSKPLSDTQSRTIKPSWFSRALPPPPLFLLQPLLARIVTKIAAKCPGLFTRLGESCDKRFLIDPLNLPFKLLLLPDPEHPQLTAVRRTRAVEHDVLISATFVTLLTMIDGRSDGDALFFNRELHIEGDTEAVVALRNALDDMDATLVDEVIDTFGLFSAPLRKAVNFMERATGK